MKYHIPKMAQMAGSDVKIMLIRDVNSVRGTYLLTPLHYKVSKGTSP